jgi:hypothetical protein
MTLYNVKNVRALKCWSTHPQGEYVANFVEKVLE